MWSAAGRVSGSFAVNGGYVVFFRSYHATVSVGPADAVEYQLSDAVQADEQENVADYAQRRVGVRRG